MRDWGGMTIFIQIEKLVATGLLFMIWGSSLAAQPMATPDAFPRTPPQSPTEALQSFRVLDGFRLELVAAEPLVADPVDIAYDPDGRAFVVEMRGYPLPAKPEDAWPIRSQPYLRRGSRLADLRLRLAKRDFRRCRARHLVFRGYGWRPSSRHSPEGLYRFRPHQRASPLQWLACRIRQLDHGNSLRQRRIRHSRRAARDKAGGRHPARFPLPPRQTTF